MSDNIEVRYNSRRLRYFRIEKEGYGKFMVQTMLAYADDYYPFTKQFKDFGVRSTVILSGSTSGARDRWYYNLTKEEVKNKLLAWRKKCESEGLGIVVKTSFR